jgi:hypothetical protein
MKPLQKEIPSLTDLLQVSPEHLRSLFVKGGLRKFGSDKKLFSFQASKFESFRSTFSIQDACETTQRKLKGMKTKQWFVRLGTRYIGDMCDPGTQGCAPVVNNIDVMRRVFQDGISRQQAQQGVTYPTDEGGEESEEDTNNPKKSDFVLLRVWRMLLPLLVKEEILNKDFWAPEIDSAAVGDALDSIVREIRQQRDDSLSSILETVQAPTSPNTKSNLLWCRCSRPTACL